ncbi:MAG: hypothetical protein LBJ91_01875 [Clostridiales Family XIII bacterium]|jgi:hypothetical protein|nr:hypothetical protein [Clostridiales Family XIII bacterium]
MNDTLICSSAILLICSGAVLLSRDGSRLSRVRDRIAAAIAYPRAMVRSSVLLSDRTYGALLNSQKSERADRGIFEAIGAARNIIAASGGAHIPADALFEQLSQTEGSLAPAFRRALAMLRVNKKDEMARRFAEEVGTPMAGDFIRILARWDDVSPEKLSSTLLSYQSALKEARTTALKRRGEVYSDLVYFPAVLNVLVVLMNFIFVSYYIEQRDLFTRLFF